MGRPVTARPRLLDLYCGEGGAARGYVDAGWEVYGVEKNFRLAKRYLASGAYAINWSDIALWDEALIKSIAGPAPYGFQAIHASSPCQVFTELNSKRERHVNLIPHTRRLLQATGLPYVIENVRAAREHLVNPVSFDGRMFGNHLVTSKGQRFDLSRERLFEANWDLVAPAVQWRPTYPIANVYGGHLRARSGEYRTGNGTGRTVDFPGEDRPALARQLMGMPWATMAGMSEAVPPAYTRWIGQQLMEQIK